MASHLDLVITQLARLNTNTSMAMGIFDPQHVIGETTAEFTMQPERVGGRQGLGWVVCPFVDCLLHFDVRDGFKLKSSFFWLRREVPMKRSVNVTRVRIMALNQIGIITVH